jgi:DNA adenine methylase
MSYNGGKGGAGVYQKIINTMPKHRLYIETHLGGGSIMRHKKMAVANIGIDIDTAVLKSFRSRIDKNDDSRGTSYIAMSGHIAENDDKDRHHSSKKAMLASIDTSRDTISLINANCIDVLQTMQFKGDELVYADPPYLFETRKSKRPLYRHEYTYEDHVELLNVLASLPCFVMISGYRSSLYMDMLQGWHYQEFTAQTRRGPAKESLWCNFDPDEHVKHDVQFIGENFRERERIKRKKERWLKNLENMPRDERDVILRSIIDKYDVGGSLS